MRIVIVGSVAFGVTAALAGYAWTAFEFPLAVLAPAAVGWYAVIRLRYGARLAGWSALVGGVTFTAAFLVAIFFALADGSPFSPSAWMSAALAAALAGGTTGGLVGGRRGSVVMAVAAGAGMLGASIVTGFLREVAPAAVDVEGPAQYAYFALVQGVMGAIAGAAIGAGVSRLDVRTAPPAAPAAPRAPSNT